jgi:Acetyltransferase (GNAT) domain
MTHHAASHVVSPRPMPSGGDPAPIAPTDHLSLFNLPAFHDLTLKAGQRRLQLDHYADDRLVGSLVGVVTGDEFASGFSAPFGGVDLVRETETLPRMIDLLAATCAELDRQGIGTIRCHARPPIYSRADVNMQFALLSSGFVVESWELNQHFDLAGMATAGDYVARLGWRGRRDLRRAAAQGLAFAEDLEPAQRAESYEVLRVNREAKGRPMRLPPDYLEGLRSLLPGRIRTFSLRDSGVACAAAVVYLIRPGRWLLVYWGDAMHQLEQSPMNLLAYELAARALSDGIDLIDLGISSAYGQLNAGLAQFKESIGAQSTLRFEFVRRRE